MSILNYEASSDDGFGNVETFNAQVEPNKVRFNPMQSWMNASKVIDQEFSKPAAQTFAANVPQNLQPYAEKTNQPYQDIESQFRPNYQAPQWNMMGQQPVSMQPPQQDPAALGFANMPYDFTGGPSQGATPDPVQAAALGSMYSPEAVEAQVMGGMPNMTADQQVAQGAMQPSPTPFDDDWMRAQEDSGSSQPEIQRQAAVIQTAARQNNGSNTAGGIEASQDPIMKSRLGPLASDPTKRREAYMKRLNTAFLQSIALDAMAAAMGVKSRSGQFMEMMQKTIDAEMKFDDEERLAGINRSVFFPNGVYDPPANKREAFERAIRAGASPEEAAAISGHLPEEEVGFDTYYKERPDGSVETIYVPKGQAPPQGATQASGVATHNAGLMNPSAGSTPADIKVVDEIIATRKAAKEAAERGDTELATALGTRADMLEKKSMGSRSRPNYLGYFNSLYGYLFDRGQYDDTDPTPFFYPNNPEKPFTKADFMQYWMKSPAPFKVLDQDGKPVTIQPWSSFNQIEDGSAPYPSEVSVNILRANPSVDMFNKFVQVYGVDKLPPEFV